MKDKNTAGILALFLGWAGIHRFYLGQIGLGILYVLLMGTGISAVLGLIDAVALFLMDPENFDRKYNRAKRWDKRRTDFDREDYDRRRQHRDQRYQDWRERQDDRRKDWKQRRETQPGRPSVKANPYKQSGIQKFKAYDYKGAIADFEKALEVDGRDIALHFNLACAYSLEENLDKALFHLDKAVAFGFKDFDRIRQHDALAFIRIQEAYAAFEENQFRLPPQRQTSGKNPALAEPDQEEDLLSTQPDLLDQVKKLGELREKGLLTEEEFAEQKRKLLG
jgi:TM2 domain-containing membrane protein YozV